jgi:hypothetical protein
VHGNEVGLRERFIELGGLDAEVLGALGAQVGIVRHDAHADRAGDAGYDRADLAQSHYAEGLPGELGAGERLLVPLARLHARVCRGDVTGHRHHHRERVLGRRGDVPERRVHDDHALRGRGRDVYVVHPDARAADKAKLARSLDHARGDLGRASDDYAVVLPGDADELVLAEPRLHVDLEAGSFENLDAARAHLVRYQNLRHFDLLDRERPGLRRR